MKELKILFIKLKMPCFIFFFIIILFFNGWPASTSPQLTQTGSSKDLEKAEKEFLNMINREREKRGLPPLYDNNRLGRVSIHHSQKMAAEEQLSHTFPAYMRLSERLEEAGLPFIKAGENVAYSKGYVVEDVHEGFMLSPGHRQNILDPDYTHCSIRIVQKNRDLYITQEFAKLYSLLRKEKILPVLKEEMVYWFQKKHKFPLTLFPGEVGDFAEFCAEENLRGRKVKSANEKWGSFYIVNLISPELEDLKKELRKKIGPIKFQGAALGAAVGIHPDHPGGVYSLTALLFPGHKHRDTSKKKLTKYVLKEVNRIRYYKGCRKLKYSKTLSRKAVEAAKLFYNHQESSFSNTEARQILVYQTYNLRSIPNKFEDFLTKQEGSGRVGIGVFDPLRNGFPGNFFIVALIFDDL
ncbi:MAG: CAP domain-containing protein [Candidatus Aminicenantes bacterium]|nr:CAP domain-containing protein [Candidatus Aminicenantes bacterium]